ncbi:hypothetical protein [Myxococcus sp. RHSTA-1-4]|uniref:hypothetical protein n=1 Tax=Myxococcus sp. RHSTA-1-4 TaxID=2874601 RepID=UPI001CC04EB7|nr:hypothetical protein [Myxococcus sp. RHSTA-1-4]MBZ4422782.1 hypothetical protein [Myxococcus sp. RHSTA-1-4]
MPGKTPEQLEAEMWERVRQQEKEDDAAQRERIRQARETSDKEPFDFERLRQLYAPIAVPPLAALPESMAQSFEENYYRHWTEVKTLQQAAEYIRWLNLHDAT